MRIEPGAWVRVDGDWREVEVVVTTELPAGGSRLWIFHTGGDDPLIVDAADAASLEVRENRYG